MTEPAQMPPAADDSLQSVFMAEATELLCELCAALDEVANSADVTSEPALGECLRLAHNLKGAAACAGREAIETLAHALEEVFITVQRTGRALSEAAVKATQAALSGLQSLADGEAVDADALVAALAQSQAGAATGAVAPPNGPVLEQTPVLGEAPVLERGDVGAAPADAEPKVRAGARSGTLRVETIRLDRLMGYAGELLVAQSRLAARYERLRAVVDACARHCRRLPDDLRADGAALLQELEELRRNDRTELLAFSHLTGDIGAAIKHVRMLPLLAEAGYWHRVVRETARRLGKEVALTVDVEGLELDRMVIDELRDAFTHLLRNAVDHGIEPAPSRVAAGKPAAGRIHIAARAQGCTARIEVSDDGRGFDLQAIRAGAVRRQLVSQAQADALDRAHCLELLFLPGFSTRTDANRVSGRGIGLDVVGRKVEALGGRVEVMTATRFDGAGFVITVPTSILSTQGLLVRVGDALFALPTESVKTTLRVAADAITRHNGRATLVIPDGEPLRIVRLASLTGEGTASDRGKLRVVVLQRARELRGLVVDDIVSQQEFVTQTLPWSFRKLPGITGAVIRPDGKVALVLDVRHLFACTSADKTVDPATVQRAPAAACDPPRERGPARILVVDDSASIREHLRRVFASAGHRVRVAADGEAAWSALQEDAFDLIVTDVQMPALDGLELTRRIRKTAALRTLPVMLVTSQGRPEDIAHGAEAGADRYLVKGSFDDSELLAAALTLL